MKTQAVTSCQKNNYVSNTGRRTLEQVAHVKILNEKCRNHQMEMYHNFIDFKRNRSIWLGEIGSCFNDDVQRARVGACVRARACVCLLARVSFCTIRWSRPCTYLPGRSVDLCLGGSLPSAAAFEALNSNDGSFLSLLPRFILQ